MWAPKGTRQRAIRQQQLEYSYIQRAVCQSKDEGATLVLPVANSEEMSFHLEEISKKTEPGRVAVVMIGRVRWHT